MLILFASFLLYLFKVQHTLSEQETGAQGIQLRQLIAVNQLHHQGMGPRERLDIDLLRLVTCYDLLRLVPVVPPKLNE